MSTQTVNPPAAQRPPVDPYPLIDRVLRSASPDSASILQAVQGLAHLRLFGPACDLLDAHADGAGNPELDALRANLRSLPTGRVEWSTLRRRFEENVRAGAERFPALREAPPIPVHLELYRTHDGNWQVATVRAGRRIWPLGFTNWRRAAERSGILPDASGLCPPFLIDGPAYGDLLADLWARTERMFLGFSPRVHLLVRSLLDLAVWLHLAEVRDLLVSPRFHLWVGPQAHEQILAFYAERTDEISPVYIISQPGFADRLDGVKYMERLRAPMIDRLRQARERIHAGLSGRDTPDWYARAFAGEGGQRLRVLGLTSRFTTFLQHSMRDIAEAFRRAGHDMRMLIEPNTHTAGVPGDLVAREIADYLPHLVLIIDHNRKEYGEKYDFRLPYCNWIQDELPHLFAPDSGAGLHPYDLVVGLVSHASAARAGYPVDQCRFIPVPVSPVVFHPTPLAPEVRDRHACEISFVTNLSITAQEHLRAMLARVTQPETRQLIGALYEVIVQRVRDGAAPASTPQTVALTQSVACDLKLEITAADADNLRRHFTDRLINIVFRHQVLEWAADLGLDLRIYGRGWENHPRLRRYARGPAGHGEELRCIYQASRLNIQAMASCATHQRLIEGVFSGGFFVIRATAFDQSGDLSQTIRERSAALGLRSDEELWTANDPRLGAAVQELNERLYAPAKLYPGFLQDLQIATERGYPMEAGRLLPDYDRVQFGGREQFERVVHEFLAAPEERARIVERQRRVLQQYFGYDAAVQRLIDFAAERFRKLAEGA